MDTAFQPVNTVHNVIISVNIHALLVHYSKLHVYLIIVIMSIFYDIVTLLCIRIARVGYARLTYYGDAGVIMLLKISQVGYIIYYSYSIALHVLIITIIQQTTVECNRDGQDT